MQETIDAFPLQIPGEQDRMDGAAHSGSHGHIIVIVAVEINTARKEAVFRAAESESQILSFPQTPIGNGAAAFFQYIHHLQIDIAGARIIRHVDHPDRDRLQNFGCSADVILVEMGNDERIELCYTVPAEVFKHIFRSLFITGVDHDGNRIGSIPGLDQDAVAFSDVDDRDPEDLLRGGTAASHENADAHDQHKQEQKCDTFH